MITSKEPIAIAPDSAYINADHNLAVQLDRLQDLMSSLRHRLQPVLQPAAEHQAAPEGSQQACRVLPAPLVSALENHAFRAEGLGNEVADLLNRACL